MNRRKDAERILQALLDDGFTTVDASLVGRYLSRELDLIDSRSHQSWVAYMVAKGWLSPRGKVYEITPQVTGGLIYPVSLEWGKEE